MSSLVYLATPYSDPNPEVRERRFRGVNKVAARLMADGMHIYSPISHCHPIALEGDLPGDWQYWQGYCRATLYACSKVIVLRQTGWESSVGVAAEVKIAEEMGLPVEFIDP